MAYEPIAAGIWPCTVLSGGAGEELDANGKPTGIIKARVNVRIDDGPSHGRLVTYEDEVNAKSSLYIMRSLQACGWHPPKLSTAADDIAKWITKTGGKSTVEIRHIEIKRGRRFDEWMEKTGGRGDPPIWDKANSIGRGPKPLGTPSAAALSDADDAMRRAMEVDGGASEDEHPENDDIPFATATMCRVGLGEIAKVLR